MKRLVAVALAAGVFYMAAACGSEGNPTGPVDPEDLIFHISLGVNLSQMTRLASGLYYQDLPAGTGTEAETGKNVTVHYTLWLHDGTKIDSSRDSNHPFTFTIGIGEVIQGWELGIPGMKVGGKRKLVIPSSLAYGSSGSGGRIPPYATLVFDVELLGVNG
jgi:peptidylprolyl isomerase